MKQLRTTLEESEFVARVARQRTAFGYTLAYLEEDGKVLTVAGFRMSECLYDGKYLYIDDLVTDEGVRSRGCGDKMFDWIVKYARENGCQELGLESGVQRFEAHRFYLRKRMKISCHHFSLDLRES
jgi:GNAT superfamily N-acetyltransferase